MAQSAANWRNTHTHLDRSHSLTQLHQRSCNHFVQSASSAITQFGIELGRGSKPEYSDKTPNSLPANRYHIIIIVGQNPTSRTGLEPSPSDIGDKFLWPRARAASDPLSYRRPQQVRSNYLIRLHFVYFPTVSLANGK